MKFSAKIVKNNQRITHLRQVNTRTFWLVLLKYNELKQEVRSRARQPAPHRHNDRGHDLEVVEQRGVGRRVAELVNAFTRRCLHRLGDGFSTDSERCRHRSRFERLEIAQPGKMRHHFHRLFDYERADLRIHFKEVVLSCKLQVFIMFVRLVFVRVSATCHHQGHNTGRDDKKYCYFSHFLNFKVENTMILALLKYHSANLFKRTGLLQNSAKRRCSEAKPAFDKSKVNTGEIRPLPEWMP